MLPVANNCIDCNKFGSTCQQSNSDKSMQTSNQIATKYNKRTHNVQAPFVKILFMQKCLWFK